MCTDLPLQSKYQQRVGRSIMQTNFRQHQQGISLIELLIAGLLGLLLSAAVVQLAMTNSENYRTQQAMSEVQQSAFFAMNFMTGELRKAGYSGNMARFEKKFQDYTNGGVNRVAALLDSDLQNDFSAVESYRALLGYYYPSSTQVPPVILVGGMSGNASDDNADSDSITIQYLVRKGDTTCAGDEVDGDFVITTTFSVKDGKLYCESALPNGSGGVTKKEDEFLQGVDSFQVLYGVDFERYHRLSPRHEEGIGAAEVYLNSTQLVDLIDSSTADASIGKPKIVSLRIALLISSEIDADLVDTSLNSLRILDANYTNTSLLQDGKYRRLYSTTVQLRNVPRSI